MDKTFTCYKNTHYNRLALGYDKVPEYCHGDRLAPWVIHDTVNGLFLFTNHPIDFTNCPFYQFA